MTHLTTPGTSADSVDLQNCDREPIHVLGAIQPFGCLLAFSADWMVVHCSDNIAEFTGRAAADVIGNSAIECLDADAIHAIRTRLQWLKAAGSTERLFGLTLFGDEPYDVAVHISGSLIVVEAERSDTTERVEAISLVRNMMSRLRQAPDLAEFLDRAARQVRVVTGYDRVMVYRFADDASGEVIAESRNKVVDGYLGLRFPASDIPRQARELYVRNIFRIIADVNAPRVPIVPQTSPTGEPLDLSMSVLRAVSEIHLEYLRNMSVGASMSISIVVDGKLWGLFACHNIRARNVAFDRRTAAELFAELFSLELANRTRQGNIENEATARRMHDSIMSMMQIEGTAFENISSNLSTFMPLVGADGCGVWVDGEFDCVGSGLSQDEARGLVRFLNRGGASRVYATDRLSKQFPDAHDYATRVSGVLAIPVSRSPRDYLLFFRREQSHAVDWAGDPNKAVETGPNGTRLTPRKSFETWREVVRERSAPWSDLDLKVAESLRSTLLEVILRSLDHSRVVRERAQETQTLLIAELNHRVRNILTLIRGIVKQTGERSATVAEFTSLLGGRIQSLARAHDQLTADQWAAAPLRPLFLNELDAYVGDAVDRVVLKGPDVSLMPEAFTCLALVMHELATNSMKYGSLSDRRGRLEVEWGIDNTGSLAVNWREVGGPPVRAPERRGFGSSLIERAVPFELGGAARIEYELTGVRANFVVPGHYVRTGAARAPEVTATRAARQDNRPAAPTLTTIDPANTAILLVEDNIVIAMDAEAMLDDIGFAEVKVASTVDGAIRLIDEGGIGCALLDVDLGGETSVPIAELLLDRGIPFVFASGYGDPALLPVGLRRSVVITKPYGEKRVMDALQKSFGDADAASASG